MYMNYRRGFQTSKKARSIKVFIVELRENKKPFQQHFFYDYCRDTIEPVSFVDIKFADDNGK